MKIAMIGSGGWGTAMVTSLAARHDDLELYCRREEAARELKETRENKLRVIWKKLCPVRTAWCCLLRPKR